jgi:hypothetical protein
LVIFSSRSYNYFFAFNFFKLSSKDQDSKTLWIRIQIRIELKCRIRVRIRIDFIPDPQPRKRCSDFNERCTYTGFLLSIALIVPVCTVQYCRSCMNISSVESPNLLGQNVPNPQYTRVLISHTFSLLYCTRSVVPVNNCCGAALSSCGSGSGMGK